MARRQTRNLSSQEARETFEKTYRPLVFPLALQLTDSATQAETLTRMVFASMNASYAAKPLPTDCRLRLMAETNLLYAQGPSTLVLRTPAENAQPDMPEKAPPFRTHSANVWDERPWRDPNKRSYAHSLLNLCLLGVLMASAAFLFAQMGLIPSLF